MFTELTDYKVPALEWRAMWLPLAAQWVLWHNWKAKCITSTVTLKPVKLTTFFKRY